MHLVVCGLSGGRFALPLAVVERIVPAVDVLPLPGAPAVVLGAVNVCGAIVPVYSARTRFGYQERAIAPDQLLLLATTASRTVGLMIDEAFGVIDCPNTDIDRTATVASGLDQLMGVAKFAGGMVVVHDLERFLSEAESAQLAGAMEQSA